MVGTESASKSDEIKIGIMLSHAGKEEREVHKTLPWAVEGDDKKFCEGDNSNPNLLQAAKILYMSVKAFGAYSN